MISNNTVSGVAISGNSVILTAGTNFSAGETITVGYSKPVTNRLELVVT